MPRSTAPLSVGVALVVALAAAAGSSRAWPGPDDASAASTVRVPSGLRVPARAQEATVVRVVDGDTVVLRGDGAGPLSSRSTRVRLLLVDTPEVGECFARQARARLGELVPAGARVRVQADRAPVDRYDRVLLHLWSDDGHVGEALLREGYARLLVLPPNRRHEAALAAAERQARQADRGRWSACAP